MTDPTIDTAPWYTPKQAAAQLFPTASKANIEKVRVLCQTGAIDYRPDGHRYLISGQAIQRYIKRTTVRRAA